MGRYVDYYDYDVLSPTKLTEDEFDGLVLSAEAFIDMITHNRASCAAGYKADRVRQAVCAVIGAMAAQNAAKNESGARLTSVSNDGYTEHYSQAASGTSDEEALRMTATRWLSGTGLVSAL